MVFFLSFFLSFYISTVEGEKQIVKNDFVKAYL